MTICCVYMWWDSQCRYQCSPNILQMCLASQGVVLGTAASAECHKYFPLFRNGSGLVAGEKEGGEDGWIVGGGERK